MAVDKFFALSLYYCVFLVSITHVNTFPSKRIHPSYQNGIFEHEATKRIKRELPYRSDKGTNASCTLYLQDTKEGSFPDMIKKIKDEGNGLIFFNLQIEGNLSATIEQSLVFPTQWIWATEYFGSNMLLFREKFPLFIHRYFHLGIEEKNVVVKAVPESCLNNIENTSLYEETVLKLFLSTNSSANEMYQSDRICKLNMRIISHSSLVEFYYNYYILSQGEAIFVKSELLENYSMTILEFSENVVLVIVLLILYRITLIYLPTIFLSLKNKNDKSCTHHGDSGELDSVKGRPREIDSQSMHLFFIDSFSVISWIYDSFIFCNIHQRVGTNYRLLKTLCNSRVLPCCRCKCFSFFRKLNLCLLLIFWIWIFVIRMILYLRIKDEEYERRNSFAADLGLRNSQDKPSFNTVIFHLSWICILLSFSLIILFCCWKLDNPFEMNENVNKDESIYDKCNPKNGIDEFINRIGGFLGFLFLFLSYLISKISEYIALKQKKVDSLSQCCVLFAIFFFSLPFFLVLADIVSAFISNITFGLFVSIINFEAYRLYIATSFSVAFYILRCVYEIEVKYRTCFETFREYIRKKIVIKMKYNSNERLKIEFNSRNLLIKKESIQHGYYLLKVRDGTPIIYDTGNQVLISRSVFDEIIMRRERGFPGKPLTNLCQVFKRISVLVMIFIYVFLVIVTFGDGYFGSNVTNTTFTIAASILPWLVGNKFFQMKATELDIADNHVEDVILDILTTNKETFTSIKSANNDNDDTHLKQPPGKENGLELRSYQSEDTSVVLINIS